MPFIFVGTMESISNAKILLDYNLDHLREVERLRQEKLEIDQQLKSLSGPQSGPYFPPPRERRDSGDPYSDSRGYRDGYAPRGRGRGRGRARRYDGDRDRYGHGDDSESGVVADWSSEVAREEGRQSGYLTDSVLSRGRGGYRGRSRRGRGGYSSGRNSDYNSRYNRPPPPDFNSRYRISYDTDNRYDRTDRSRRRMTDDDDTVLDNASVNSQDQDYTSGDRRQAERRRRRRRQRGTGRGNGSAASGTETDSSVSGYHRGYRGSAPPRSTSQNTIPPVNQPSASKSDNQRQSPGPAQTLPTNNRPQSQSRNDAGKGSSASAAPPKEQRDRPFNRNAAKSSQNAVRNGQSGSESDSKAKKPQNSSSVKKEQLVNGE